MKKNGAGRREWISDACGVVASDSRLIRPLPGTDNYLCGSSPFLLPVITVAGHGGSGGSVGFYSGGVGVSGSGSSSTAGAELVFIRASDGKEFIHGEGFGKSGFRSQKSVVSKIFRRILEKAFPEER